MRSSMSFASKRELLAQVAPRYREAVHQEKSTILDQFVAATGYARKYAIRLLQQPIPLASKEIKRPRARRYGQAALAVAWTAANCICGKRPVPFLPELVPVLEAHGHLTLTDEVRSQLLAISPATADRILSALRPQERRRGTTTTRSGPLLKQQVPVRTFADWNDDNDIGLALTAETTVGVQKRKYRRTQKSLGPRTYRTHPDPFEAVKSELHQWFLAAPDRPVKCLLQELQAHYPGQYPDNLLRTLQRRVGEWRREVILEFDDGLIREDALLNQSLPAPLRAVPMQDSALAEMAVVPISLVG
jgi:hypothetical protein